ncbi:MAG: hypothetical protein EXR58_07970 [Chloroflexi bacterium]|nr:hypothetical protein [Chloroflexota bacterium]
MILQPDQVVGGMSTGSVLTYTLIAGVFAQQLDVRTELGDTLWSGAIATRYLQPIGIVGMYAAELMGHWAFAFATFSLPLSLAAPLLGVDARPASPAHAVAFILSLGLE